MIGKNNINRCNETIINKNAKYIIIKGKDDINLRDGTTINKDIKYVRVIVR